MRKISVILGLLAALALPPLANAACTGYQPVQGDSLWALAKSHFGNPSEWQQRIWDANPQIHGPGRLYSDGRGRTIVRIFSTDCLQGLTSTGALKFPYWEPARSEAHGDGTGWFSQLAGAWWPWLLIVLALLLLGAAAWLIAKARSEVRHAAAIADLDADASTAGPPVVEGGVSRFTAPEHFRRLATRVYRERTGMPVATSSIVIERVVAGRASSIVGVRYADGQVHDRRLHDEPAFLATVRYPDATAEELYMLQRCGNDLRAGTRYAPEEDFRFVPDAEDQAPPAPAAPAANDARSVAVAEPATPPGVVRCEYRPEAGERPAMLRVSGVDPRSVNCEVTHDSVTFRFDRRGTDNTSAAVAAE
ncbi:MAG: LysM peptidoglycan-binding domain-containing protein [Patescibacteria group bacterium]|nr:LysM peptidoglycan-binding domain-containing protein [Patescibacteria group bacterium]MDE1944935.1 LysM peptidoglycan-binding domain-containing protein [Patescibacteria group bacterium]MDE2057456.1 LysM peptidoglycan-binding domain-containing protein [Patescibacteria group bacterium]